MRGVREEEFISYAAALIGASACGSASGFSALSSARRQSSESHALRLCAIEGRVGSPKPKLRKADAAADAGCRSGNGALSGGARCARLISCVRIASRGDAAPLARLEPDVAEPESDADVSERVRA